MKNVVRRHVRGGRAMRTRALNLTEVVCWTRMQAEAGQNINRIIARKEAERRAGGGLYLGRRQRT